MQELNVLDRIKIVDVDGEKMERKIRKLEVSRTP